MTQLSTIEIYFDGGCNPNPGWGYGSYLIKGPALTHKILRAQFGRECTNNIAEYMALLFALRWLRHHADPAIHNLQIWTDSKLVREQVRGRWRVKVEHIRELWREVREILGPYHWQIDWHPRKNNVRLFGH